MSLSNVDWIPQFLHTHSPSISSLHSFASSSSTLASPPSSLSSTTSFKHSLLITSREIIHEPLQRPHWRKTPLTPRGLLSLLFRLITFLLSPFTPSFLDRNAQPRKLHPTSYLDGLRGVAAFIVFVDHFAVPWFENLKYGYGSSEENYWLPQLPIVRLVYSGRASVGVFFVVSGYVLSSKPLQLIHASNHVALAATLSSAVLRRGMRLYFPIIAGTFFSMIVAGNGYYLNVPAQTATLPPSFDTWEEQACHWVYCTMELVFPFREVSLKTPFSPAYNGHLWTIPVEFLGSIVVFVTLLGLGSLRTNSRLSIVAGLGFWSLSWGRWDTFLFLGGAVLAELNIISCESNENLPFSTQEGTNRRLRFGLSSISSPSIRFLLRGRSKLKPMLNLCALGLSLYLLSFTGDIPPIVPTSTPNPDLTTLPTNPSSDPYTIPEPPPPNHGTFYRTPPNLIPASYSDLWNGPELFILSLGSVLLVWCLSNSRGAQRPFEIRLAQYLGDISYSLYIIHGMIVFLSARICSGAGPGASITGLGLRQRISALILEVEARPATIMPGK